MKLGEEEEACPYLWIALHYVFDEGSVVFVDFSEFVGMKRCRMVSRP